MKMLMIIFPFKVIDKICGSFSCSPRSLEKSVNTARRDVNEEAKFDLSVITLRFVKFLFWLNVITKNISIFLLINKHHLMNKLYLLLFKTTPFPIKDIEYGSG